MVSGRRRLTQCWLALPELVLHLVAEFVGPYKHEDVETLALWFENRTSLPFPIIISYEPSQEALGCSLEGEIPFLNLTVLSERALGLHNVLKKKHSNKHLRLVLSAEHDAIDEFQLDYFNNLLRFALTTEGGRCLVEYFHLELKVILGDDIPLFDLVLPLCTSVQLETRYPVKSLNDVSEIVSSLEKCEKVVMLRLSCDFAHFKWESELHNTSMFRSPLKEGFHGLSYLQNLRFLELSFVNNESAPGLISAFERLERLEYVKLCFADFMSIQLFSTHMEANTTLKYIDFRLHKWLAENLDCCIQEMGKFMRSLRYNESLRTLTFEELLSDRNLQDLVELIEFNQGLKCLDLGYLTLTKHQAEKIALALASNHSLKRLQLTDKATVAGNRQPSLQLLVEAIKNHEINTQVALGESQEIRLIQTSRSPLFAIQMQKRV